MNINFRVLVPLLLLLSLLTSSMQASTTILVDLGPYASAGEAGNCEAKVNWNDTDTADDTVCTAAFAALELQHYLRSATGKQDDFQILDDGVALPDGDLLLIGGPATNAASRQMLAALKIDEAQLAKLGAQEYRLKSALVDGRRVTLLAGGAREGTLYAVYDYLYRLGCRWFGPGELNEDIPQVSAFPDIDVVERPSFVTRGFHDVNDRGTTDFLLWMARNRMNYWGVVQSNHPFLRKLGLKLEAGGHDVAKMLDGAGRYPYAHPRFAAASDLPPDPYAISSEFRGDANGNGWLSYGEAHPEWFGLQRDRKLGDKRGVNRGMNYCTSNADATTEFMKNIVRSLTDGEYRDADIIRFWMKDNGGWCQCDACKALGRPTDRNLLLVNRLVKELKKARVEGRLPRPVEVRFLAYADVIQPPTRPLPADFDYKMAMATFYPAMRCYVHNIDDAKCSTNARFCRQLYGWAVDPARHYRGNLTIGEYYNISRFRNLPMCFMHTMANDIPCYYRNGARNFEYMHVTTTDWGSKALTNYQMARQIWNVDTDCQALWADYFSRRYGPAAPVMREYYANIEKMLCNMTVIKWDFAKRLDKGEKKLFKTSHFSYERDPNKPEQGTSFLEMVAYGKKCRALIDAAAKTQPALPERFAARIADDERGLAYTERTLAYYVACVEGFRLARAGQLEQAWARQREAARLAELLRKDNVSIAHSYIARSTVANALDGSVAPHAAQNLEKLLQAIENPVDKPSEKKTQ